MIERYTIKNNVKALKKITNSDDIKSFDSQYNAAPTKLLPIISVKSSNEISYTYWGSSPDYAKNNCNPSLIYVLNEN